MSAAVAIPDLAPVLASAAEARTGADTMTSTLLTVPVTAENTQWATDTAKAVRQFKKNLEAQRDSGTKPLLGVVETIRGWFRDPIAACDQVYDYLTSGVATVVQLQRAEQQRALAAAAASASPVEIARAVDAIVEKPTGTRETTYYSAKIVDPTKVPATFWVINQQALDAHARATKTAFAVPGCELVADTKVVPR